MKTMNFEQMENVNGGINCERVHGRGAQTVMYIASIGSCLGVIGLAICGPTALILGAASLYCTYQ